LYFKKFSARVNASSSIVSLKENLKIRQLIATENAYDPTNLTIYKILVYILANYYLGESYL